MAKGLRSKAKRKNRSALRANLSEPINRQRQEKLALELKRDLDSKAGNSIRALKNVLQTERKLDDKKLNNEVEIVENDGGDEDDNDAIGDDEPTISPQLLIRKLKSSKKMVLKRKSNKPLEWF